MGCHEDADTRGVHRFDRSTAESSRLNDWCVLDEANASHENGQKCCHVIIMMVLTDGPIWDLLGIQLETSRSTRFS